MPPLPSWFTALRKPILRRLASFPFNPFTQPTDTTGYVELHSNDYLRLATHPEVIEASCTAMRRAGSGVLASSVFAADRDLHRAFEDQLAEVAQAETSLLSTSGWTANVGLIEAISAQGRPVYLDKYAHASLWLGAKLGRGSPIALPHNRPDQVEPILRAHGPGLLVIDAVYSTTGSSADIQAYASLAERYDSVLVVDESHSFGIFGELGGGLAVHQACAPRVHFRTLSLAKALGGAGGAILGDATSIRWLRYRATSLVFSSAPPPAASSSHNAALRIIGREPWRARRCLENAEHLRARLVADNVDVASSAASPIVSLIFDNELVAAVLVERLKHRRVLSSLFVVPATPRGTSLIRFSSQCEISASQIEHAARSIVAELDALGLRAPT